MKTSHAISRAAGSTVARAMRMLAGAGFLLGCALTSLQGAPVSGATEEDGGHASAAHAENTAQAESTAGSPRTAAVKTIINPRTTGMKDYPCLECHDSIEVRPPTMPPRGRHRNMTFGHMETVGECYQCHNPDDINTLRLITGVSVSFDESHKLCGQCHSEKKKDWDIGAHGKYVGGWRGVRHKYTCVDCHDAHEPAIGTMSAKPPPPFPRFGISKKEAHHDE